jgi:hypothetical protein
MSLMRTRSKLPQRQPTQHQSIARRFDVATTRTVPLRRGLRTRQSADGIAACKRPHLAPLYVNTVLFPPFDGAPVLAVVKQTALDNGCGPALFWGVGNWPKNGLVGSFRRG